MFSNLRSLIFKLDPEIAHSLAIKSLKFNFVPNILQEDKDNPLFKTKLFDKDLENPIGMAAGFDKNAEVYNSLFKLGFGFVEVGTITPLKQYGNLTGVSIPTVLEKAISENNLPIGNSLLVGITMGFGLDIVEIESN